MSFNSDIFPHLGAFPGEVGSGTSPGGIGGPWRMNLPLNYFWNFGSKRKRVSRRRKRVSRRRVSRRSRRSRRSRK